MLILQYKTFKKERMKKILLGAVSLIAAVPATGTSIDATEAFAKAEKFWSEESQTRANKNITLAYEAPGCFYIFNNLTDSEFIILSASTDVPEVLGWSDCGTFHFAQLPDNVKSWVDGYRLQLENACSHSVPKVNTDYKAVWNNINPLIKTQWSQHEPFNNMCPEIAGKKCITGCVATATAQVMKYFEWPTRGNSSHSYSWNGTTLSIDFSQQTFDWKNMTDTYGNSATDAQNNAVALLMKCCGYAVDMNYGVDESGGASANISPALYNFFNYHSKTAYRDTDNEEWESMVYEELAAGRPVIYRGEGSDNSHAFIIDGYADGLFHVNWGWGGYLDGYFLLTDLNPGNQNVGYVKNQGMTYDIRPFERVIVNSVNYEVTSTGAIVIPSVGTYPEDVVIPQNITFEGKSYQVIGIDASVFDGMKNVVRLTIEAPVIEELKNEQFYGCGIEYVSLPSSLKRLGDNVFYRSKLKEFNGPGVEFVGSLAFCLCADLEKVQLSPNLIKIGRNAFNGCEALTQIELPSSITDIESGAFQSSGLTSVVLPENIEVLQNTVFSNCDYLESITLNDNLKAIGGYAFSGCSSLPFISIPAGVEEIENHAFMNTFSLARVDCYAYNPPVIGFYTFDFPNVSAELHVPKGRKEAYSEARGWEYFHSIIADLGEGEEDPGEGPGSDPDDAVDVILSPEASFEVYSVCGVHVAGKGSADFIRELPKGIYILVGEGKTVKFIK